MGDPRKLKKKYETPKHPWEGARITEESRLVREYGLGSKREVWVAEEVVRKYRRLTRQLVGLSAEARQAKEGAFLGKLRLLGILKEGATLDDALSVKTEDYLGRRLQTLVWKKGLASTVVQARQLINHGHIALGGRKTTAPGMILDTEKEKLIGWYGEPVQLTFKKAAPEPQKPQAEGAAKETPERKGSGRESAAEPGKGELNAG
jgi:small subunit ribosomal protein S4